MHFYKKSMQFHKSLHFCKKRFGVTITIEKRVLASFYLCIWLIFFCAWRCLGNDRRVLWAMVHQKIIKILFSALTIAFKHQEKIHKKNSQKNSAPRMTTRIRILSCTNQKQWNRVRGNSKLRRLKSTQTKLALNICIFPTVYNSHY